MKKHYTSPEVESFLLTAEETVATKNIMPLNDDQVDGDLGVSDSIFG